MPGRTWQGGDRYKYGFNGKEHDDEVQGSGNSLDFGARIYDPRVARWLSMDPKKFKYPYFSPYVGFGNNPNIFIDPGGETLRVFGSKSTVDRFKGLIQKQFAGKVIVEKQKNAENMLCLRSLDGESLTTSEAALFNAINSEDETRVGVIRGNETMRLVLNGEIQKVSSETTWFGARGDNMQIIDLDDVEAMEIIGTVKEGLGPTAGGIIGHEVAEANKYQNHRKEMDPLGKGESNELIGNICHTYATEKVENIITGTLRDVSSKNFEDFFLTRLLLEGDQKILFGWARFRYLTPDGPMILNYQINRGNLVIKSPVVMPDDTPPSSVPIPDSVENEGDDPEEE